MYEKRFEDKPGRIWAADEALPSAFDAGIQMPRGDVNFSVITDME